MSWIDWTLGLWPRREAGRPGWVEGPLTLVNGCLHDGQRSLGRRLRLMEAQRRDGFWTGRRAGAPWGWWRGGLTTPSPWHVHLFAEVDGTILVDEYPRPVLDVDLFKRTCPGWTDEHLRLAQGLLEYRGPVAGPIGRDLWKARIRDASGD